MSDGKHLLKDETDKPLSEGFVGDSEEQGKLLARIKKMNAKLKTLLKNTDSNKTKDDSNEE